MSKNKIFLVLAFLCIILVTASLSFYYQSLKPVGEKTTNIFFVIEPGTSTSDILSDLEKAGLIRNATVALIYTKLNNLSLKAGTYEINHSMSANDMLQKVAKGEHSNDIRLTFVEGKRLSVYVKQISESFHITEDEIFATLADETYLKQLIASYDFLTDEILNKNIYYSLEGYIFPDTYDFKRNATIKDIIKKMLDNTKVKLDEYKELIKDSNYTVHEILAMASIVELEGNSKGDREKISGVIYNRLKQNMSLGMDVTTYYAVKKDMGQPLYKSDLAAASPYNTSSSNPTNMAGKLPVGPICNPSLISINSVLKPDKNDYLYFYADIKTGIVYFTKTYEEHIDIIKEIG